ncbi:MAG: FtsQ-type POTRA domain-containing protein [Bacilli bacterium]|nr:FtsQ-type POTRA domain-containing protein [Bacilli bacterium]
MSKKEKGTSNNQKYKTEKRVVYKTVKKKRFKIKFHMVILAILILYLLGYSLYLYLNRPISNIYVSGNNYYSDWQIIEMAGIDNYPIAIKNLSSKMESKLEKDILIKEAKVKKKDLTKVYIDIEENRPLFYDETKGKTILENKKETSQKFNVPTLVNKLPKEFYNEFIDKINNLDEDVFSKISEIKFSPDGEQDEGRILLTMNDGNYVYVTMIDEVDNNSFELLNTYNDIIKKFNNKKGILNLHYGNYFKFSEK